MFYSHHEIFIKKNKIYFYRTLHARKMVLVQRIKSSQELLQEM